MLTLFKSGPFWAILIFAIVVTAFVTYIVTIKCCKEDPKKEDFNISDQDDLKLEPTDDDNDADDESDEVVDDADDESDEVVADTELI